MNGRNTYYFACPAAHCGLIYKVTELNETPAARHPGKLVCPYCGWVLDVGHGRCFIARELTIDLQDIVRKFSTPKAGILDFLCWKPH